VALDALVEVAGGARANAVVPRRLGRSGLEPRDRHLVTELVYGACRMQRACDWLAGRHLRGRPDPEVRAALRLGVYQLGWTRVPAHAAVAATVAEVRGAGRSVVNAVLRRVATDLGAGLVAWPDLATELSYPDWIVDRLSRDLGPQAARAALEEMNRPGSGSARDDGYVQDRASQMVVEHLMGYSGGTVIDLCAAPGGKATGLAAGPGGVVVASDIDPSRVAVLASAVSRLGAARVAPVVADGTRPAWRPGVFDLVLVDAPCSGLGVLRRRPDARWRIRPGDVERLARLQRRLLDAAADLVRPGGVVAYSVCTLTSAETAAVDRWLAADHPELVPRPPLGPPWRPAGRGALLLPQAEGTDGMFLAVFAAR
jgi:16S rRNA (cytosine967-C5)-methyltransferase